MDTVTVQLQREWTDESGVKHPAFKQLVVDNPELLFKLVVVDRVVSLGWVGMTGDPAELQSWPGPT